jgi:putative RNA 2'-phosphotransferase
MSTGCLLRSSGSGSRATGNAYSLIVEASDKQRFELSADGARIRARQGHSVAVTLDWPQVEPPELLYHGTVARFLPAIRAEGLRPMRRHHVLLSPDEATATIVGNRQGQAVVLTVRAGAMAAAGRAFFFDGERGVADG